MAGCLGMPGCHTCKISPASNKEEYDQMLVNMNQMLEYKTLLLTDKRKAQEMLKNWHEGS